MQKKNIALCIPSGKLVDFSFFKSYANSIGRLMIAYNCVALTVASPMIFENRNEILRQASKIEESTPGFLLDYLVWIDNDIVFNFEQVQELISHLEKGRDFISGVYFNPNGNGIRPVAYWKDGESYKWLEESELKGLMEVDAVGFGFCAIKMDAVRRMVQKHFPRPFNLRLLDAGSLVTEDLLFCERLKELGYKIWLDASIVVKHAKGYLPR